MGSILPDEDQLSVNAIEVSVSNDHLIVSAAKSNAIVTAAVKYDGNELGCTDVKYTLLPGLQLSGWIWYQFEQPYDGQSSSICHLIRSNTTGRWYVDMCHGGLYR